MSIISFRPAKDASQCKKKKKKKKNDVIMRFKNENGEVLTSRNVLGHP